MGEAGSSAESPAAPAAPSAGLSRGWALAAVGIIIAAGLLAYCNSFRGPFVFDDIDAILRNPNIRRLWPIQQAMSGPPASTVAGRPILSLSLALNYAVSGLMVWSYHAVNLAVHVLAALVLFGIVRRTLLAARLSERFGRASTVLALISAVIWLVHPLQTESVTYVIQRAESLMGLLYLLTLYCAVRGFASARKGWWYAAAVACCGLGMATKEVMATAPLMVLIYDRVFVGRSFREVFARRWPLYAGLAATWVILGALVGQAPRAATAGFGLPYLRPLDYARTQCNVIVHYLNRAIWPHPLVLDYGGWPVAKSFGDIAFSGLVLAALLVGTVVAFRRRPALGFLGAWFFLILGPTSSFMPIKDVVVEHRMYLPLAALAVAGVTCAYALGERFGRRRAASADSRRIAGWVIGCGLAGVVAVVLGLVTLRRNHDYRSELSIWHDTVVKRRRNPRARNNRGLARKNLGQYDRAIADYSEAIRLSPRYGLPYNNRGVAWAHRREYDRAILDFTRAIRLNPRHLEAYNNRGNAYKAKGEYDKAIADYDRALAIHPRYAAARANRQAAVRARNR